MLSSNSGKCCAAAAAAVAVAGIGVGLWAWYTGRRIDDSSGDGHCCGKGKQEEEESSKALVCLGLMSGTSVDGIDAALCRVCVHRKQREQGKPCSCSQLRDKEGLVEGPLASVQLVGFTTVPWPAPLRSRILATIHNSAEHGFTLEELGRLNVDVGRAFGDAALTALKEFGVKPCDVDCIGSHGQTVHHNPPVSTTQIGDAACIAATTDITTVANFRVADVARGGQGAPLTSTFDWALLRPAGGSTQPGWRAVQNIGGIANATLLPPASLGATAQPIAFDSGPGNALIDMAAGLHDAALACDVDGKIAASGTVVTSLLETMLAHPFLALEPPKSTGREVFTAALLEEYRSAAPASCSSADFVATLTEFTAVTIADAYRRFLPPGAALSEVIVGGGGCRNPVLMQRLQAHVAKIPGWGSSCSVVTHEQIGIDSDAKEGMVFALLAALAMAGEHGNVPACTGASASCVLGQITPA